MDVLKHYHAGDKLRLPHWGKKEYVQKDPTGEMFLMNGDGDEESLNLLVNFTNWELYLEVDRPRGGFGG